MTPPETGIPEGVVDGLRRVLAPNPGPMTHWGTNSYILGEGRVAVIDPGPSDPAHLAALLRATEGETVTHIVVTHAHADHSPLARTLAAQTGASIFGFGPPEAGRSKIMQQLAATDLAGGSEGVDSAFQPDHVLQDGDTISSDGWEIRVLHTPGHFAGHLAFGFGDVILSGDHVMDWSSSLVSPPDGDLGAFMRTSERLKTEGAACLMPGHGNPIDAPTERLDWLIRHRRTREDAILNALGPNPRSVLEITTEVYHDIPEAMHPVAARNVFAHLIDLYERNMASALPELAISAAFRLP